MRFIIAYETSSRGEDKSAFHTGYWLVLNAEWKPNRLGVIIYFGRNISN